MNKLIIMRLLDENQQLETKLYLYLIKESYWKCTEYANKTTINPEWLDNCCIYIEANIGGGEKEEYDMTINKTNFTMAVSNQQNNTLYSGGKICFDDNDDFESVTIGNQTADMAKCSTTPKMIPTNETICVAKRLKGY